MCKVVVSLLIGAAAGAIDSIPMLAMALPWQETASAFVHWLVLGFLITHVELPVPSWLKGLIIAALTAIPILLLVSGQGMQAMAPIAASSVILGAAVGWATGKWCG